MSNDKEVELNDVTSILNRWYFQRVRRDAENYATEIKRGDYDDAEAVSDALREYCDDADVVIYTYQAQLVYAASDNSSEADGEIEDMGCKETATAEMRAAICLRLDIEATIPAFLECSVEEWFERKAEEEEEAERKAEEEEASE